MKIKFWFENETEGLVKANSISESYHHCNLQPLRSVKNKYYLEGETTL